MDVINDFVGNKYIDQGLNLDEGIPKSTGGICEDFREKGMDALFIGKHINPMRWVNEHEWYAFYSLIFRNLRSGEGFGPVVTWNGRYCNVTS